MAAHYQAAVGAPFFEMVEVEQQPCVRLSVC